MEASQPPVFRLVALFVALLVSTTVSSQQTGGTALDVGRFELSSVVKSLMIDRAGRDGFHGDYLYFKSLLSGLHLLTEQELRKPSPESFAGNPDEYLYVYEGKMPLYVKGQRFLAENMEDRYLWSVHVAGPKAFVSSVFIRSEKPVARQASGGANYFANSGLKLDPLTCESPGQTSANYTAFYRVSAPNKNSLILGISKSTGSGGVWYSYEIAWYGIKPSKLGPEVTIGLCQIAD